ncbi:MAG: methyltransferase [Rhodospirillales bacterium]|nr:methyltransferase [Rhodospirillales bacterium]
MIETTEDSLLGGTVHFSQPKEGYRTAIDPVLLAASVEAKTGETVLDLGSGAGAASMCLMQRVKGVSVTGIELQPHFVKISKHNADANQFAEYFQVIEGDFMTLNHSENFNHVITNPPFFEEGRGTISPNRSKALAHIEESGVLADWLAFAVKMTKHKGSVTIIQRADRLDEILTHLWGVLGELVVYPLWPGPVDKEGAKGAKRVIVRGRKGLATPLRLAPGLILHNENGSYTERAEAILRHGTALHL